MSEKKAIIAFAEKILQRFPPYNWDESKEIAWAQDMVLELSGYSAEVVERASREMVRTRKKKETPLISECINACVEAKRVIDGERNGGRLQIESVPAASHLDWTATRMQFADELVMAFPQAKQAAKEGWARALWDFARTNGRLPQPGKRVEYRKNKHATPVMVDEVEWCKREARDFVEHFEWAVRLKAESVAERDAAKDEFERRKYRQEAKMYGSLIKLGDQMLAKRKGLEDRILRRA